MPICVDPTGRTFVYSLYVETLALAAGNEDLEGTEVVCRWTVKGLEERSAPVTLSTLPNRWHGLCSFLIVSFADVGDRSMCIRLAVSHVDGGDDLCVAFLDLAMLSQDERFKVDFIELRSAQLQVCAIAKLHSACQQRWTQDGSSPVEPPAQAHFLESSTDDQARRLELHIASAAGLMESAAAKAAEHPQTDGCDSVVCPKAEPTAPRDPEEDESCVKRNGGGSSMGTESTDVPTERSEAALEADAGNEARLRPADDPGQGGLWGFLGLFGCRPECVAARCGCNWMEAEGDGSSFPPEQAQGACREEDVDFHMPAPAVAAALSRGQSQGHGRKAEGTENSL